MHCTRSFLSVLLLVVVSQLAHSATVPGCACPTAECTNAGSNVGVCDFNRPKSSDQSPWVFANDTIAEFCPALLDSDFATTYGPDNTTFYAAKGPYYTSAGISFVTGKGPCASAIQEQNSCSSSTLASVGYTEAVPGECKTYNGLFGGTKTGLIITSESYSDPGINTGWNDTLEIYISGTQALSCDTQPGRFPPDLKSADWEEVTEDRRYMCKEVSSGSDVYYVMLLSLGNPPVDGPGSGAASLMNGSLMTLASTMGLAVAWSTGLLW